MSMATLKSNDNVKALVGPENFMRVNPELVKDIDLAAKKKADIELFVDVGSKAVSNEVLNWFKTFLLHEEKPSTDLSSVIAASIVDVKTLIKVSL